MHEIVKYFMLTDIYSEVAVTSKIRLSLRFSMPWLRTMTERSMRRRAVASLLTLVRTLTVPDITRRISRSCHRVAMVW